MSRLWDFNTDTPDVPDSSAITDALAYVDYTKVSLSTDNDGTHHISIPDGYCLDLGAIAYSLITILDGLDGGNVLCIGQKRNGSDFNIAVKKPFTETGEYMEVLHINDYSVVSSGTYERYFYSDDGTFYHHILNPATGYPYDNNLCDVTIISSESTVGDCLSTTCFVLGLDDGMKLINSLEGIEAIFMTNDGSKYYSDNAKAYIN